MKQVLTSLENHLSVLEDLFFLLHSAYFFCVLWFQLIAFKNILHNFICIQGFLLEYVYHILIRRDYMNLFRLIFKEKKRLEKFQNTL